MSVCLLRQNPRPFRVPRFPSHRALFQNSIVVAKGGGILSYPIYQSIYHLHKSPNTSLNTYPSIHSNLPLLLLLPPPPTNPTPSTIRRIHIPTPLIARTTPSTPPVSRNPTRVQDVAARDAEQGTGAVGHGADGTCRFYFSF